MILSALRTLFRKDLNDVFLPYEWADAEIDLWTNEAVEEACLRARLIYDEGLSYAVTKGVRAYPLQQRLISVEYATLTGLDGKVWPLAIRDRQELDREDPERRTRTERPSSLIHEEGRLELNVAPDADYTLKLEAFRYPGTPMAGGDDVAAIQDQHCPYLTGWVQYRAYSKPDKDRQDLKLAAQRLGDFERYFGLRPVATGRRRYAANKPAHNKVW